MSTPEPDDDCEMLATRSQAEQLTRLTRGLAHDFNNLLAIIVGNIQLAREKVADLNVQAFLAEAETASIMAADLIARLKAVATDQPLRLEMIDVAALLREARALLQTAAGTTVNVEILAERNAASIESDRNALLNAVLNLVINAKDAMPTGGTVTITVREFRTEDGKNTVAITVADNGAGMSPNIAERAFDPYFTTKSPAGGHGLGLASVLGFARQCGGEAEIESALAKGTAVTLTLPTATATKVTSRSSR